MSDYISPSPEELKSLLYEIGLSRSETGKLADVTGNKIGKWCSGDVMPYSVLFTIVAKSYKINISQKSWREEIASFKNE
jgi:predicted transcriptional regulator